MPTPVDEDTPVDEEGMILRMYRRAASGTLTPDRPRGTSMKNRVPLPGVERTSTL
jgi:hypothetical protein